MTATASTVPPVEPAAETAPRDKPPASAASSRDKQELTRLRHVAGTVLTYRILFVAVGWLGFWLMAEEQVRPDLSLRIWERWDAIHFLAIADVGYDPSIAHGNAAAFFPGFPLAVRALDVLGFGLVAAGLVVPLLGTLVAGYYLHRLAEGDGHDGDRTVLALLLFPTAVFLAAPYSEALFLAGAIPAFYHARHGRPWRAIPFVLLASLTRTVGLLVAAGAAIEILRRSKPLDRGVALRAGAVAIAGTAPIIGYGLHLQATKGDFFEFLHAQERGWLRRLTNPLDAFLASWGSWYSDREANLLVSNRVEIVFAILGVALVFWLARQREWGYLTFVGGTLFLALASPLYLSIPRFCLTFFPFAFMIADATEEPSRERFTFPLMSGLAMVGVIVFVNDRWFF